MKVAIIHDWLWGMRGGERCLEVLCQLLPEADIFTLFYESGNISPIIRRHCPQPSFLQSLPKVKNYYRYLLPLYPLAAKDLSLKIARRHAQNPYDLVISVSHCAAKNVKLPKGVTHICYCLSPMRYIWDQFDAYFKGRLLEPVAKFALKPLRKWDVKGSKAITHFVAISEYIKQRIKRVYNCDASVIFPPVRTDWICQASKECQRKAYIVVSALVPYKNVHVIVEAFNMLGEELLVVGTGPEESRLRKIAGPNIKFLGWVSDEQLSNLYAQSRAMVFAAEEDFGMTPVEAQYVGRPVVAYGRGGALETVMTNGDFQTGVLFNELSAEAICVAVKEFEAREQSFTEENCRRKAVEFAAEKFEFSFVSLLESMGFTINSQSAVGKKIILGQ